MSATSIPTRRDNLHTVYMYIVRNWAVDVNDMATGFAHLDAASANAVKTLTKEQIRSLLASLERKGLVVGEQVNGEGLKVWQSYHDVENEDGAVDSAEADFLSAFPNEVADTKSPTKVAKHAPDAGMIVYEVKRVRKTGSRTLVTFEGPGDSTPTKWSVTCATHGIVHNVNRRMTAEALAHHPEVWCDDCKHAVKKAGV